VPPKRLTLPENGGIPRLRGFGTAPAIPHVSPLMASQERPRTQVMNIRFENIRSKAASAAAALALSTVFIGAAIGQPVSVPANSVQSQNVA
jgi:hypothetical protein